MHSWGVSMESVYRETMSGASDEIKAFRFRLVLEGPAVKAESLVRVVRGGLPPESIVACLRQLTGLGGSDERIGVYSIVAGLPGDTCWTERDLGGFLGTVLGCFRPGLSRLAAWSARGDGGPLPCWEGSLFESVLVRSSVREQDLRNWVQSWSTRRKRLLEEIGPNSGMVSAAAVEAGDAIDRLYAVRCADDFGRGTDMGRLSL
jgi:hypothetical protein